MMTNGTWKVFTFKYLEVVHKHFKYRDVIDSHSSHQMHPIAVEETWMMTCWLNCVLFLLAVTMANVHSACVYFCTIPKVNSLTAHKLIAQQLIENRYLIVEQTPRKC